ncbi:MAG: Holliday junction branch migration protein RuvA [Candidatus Nomurabacteria bacterium]|jgi:Holliday junction DNA helicase RuvA|nr:Holliday junction branch migration protein RuvA [Candidatus Nomurabacteria bacterium]
MIARLSGIIVEKTDKSVIIDVGGVGYEVFVASVDYENLYLNEPAILNTYHHVRDVSEELFGFSSLVGKRLFELLTTVQGVGPKAAMAILSVADFEAVRNAIAQNDANFIAQAAGVGKKTAERVALDLHDKVGAGNINNTGFIVGNVARDDALEALIALGYSLADATTKLKDLPADLPTPEKLRQALAR